MKVDSVHTHLLSADLARPFTFSQWTYSRRTALLVEVRTDSGLAGWGEAYGPPHAPRAAIRDYYGPMMMGRDPRDVEALWSELYARAIDYGQKGSTLCALSALDIACWDIKAQDAGVPLYRLLGGAFTESIPCYATGFYPPPGDDAGDSFEAEARDYLERGFRAVKMKVGFGIQRDLRLIRRVRSLIGPSIRLMIDANHAYTPAEAIRLGRAAEEYDIFWFEEPVSPHDIDGYCQVKRALTCSIAGGECEYTRFGFEPLLRRRAVDYVQPDLCACGGITEGLKIAALASVYNIHLTPHAWGSAVGQAAALHFYAARPRHPATLTAEDKMIECDQTENPFRTGIVRAPVPFRQGTWVLPQTPGLCVEILPDRFGSFAV